jgi:hypothetical protein
MFAANIVFSLLMFYITLLCSKIGIQFQQLDIHSGVITYFLTEKQFKNILKETNLKANTLRTENWLLCGVKLGKADHLMQISKTNI